MADARVTNPLAVMEGCVGLDRVVELARRNLGLDLVYVAELVSETMLFRAVAGDPASFHVDVGKGGPSEGTYSQLLVRGEIPNVIPDASADARVAELPVTKAVGIGAFIGVPLRLSDGTLYGTLCGIDHNADLTLGVRDVRFMTMLAELMAHDLDEQRRRERLTHSLVDLIESDDIDIAYQPVIDLRSGGCVGVEALARFSDAFGQAEDLFVEADSVGMRLDVERLAIRQSWLALERLRPDQFLAFNVSPDALLELAQRAQERDDLPLPRLVVEITEQSAVQCYDELRRALTPLRAEGLRIAVDDAGAGFASMHHIVELKPDFIKVDRSLVHGLADDHARRVAVSAFVLLSLDIGATVIGEGVERPRDLSALCEIGVHAAQGYLLGRPSTEATDLIRWTDPSLAVVQKVVPLE